MGPQLFISEAPSMKRVRMSNYCKQDDLFYEILHYLSILKNQHIFLR